jgi:hypothetical protein
LRVAACVDGALPGVAGGDFMADRRGRFMKAVTAAADRGNPVALELRSRCFADTR